MIKLKPRKRSKLVYGIGINDADYVVQKSINGKRDVCPFYQTWNNMLMRCYSNKYQETRPTYVDCSVCDEWLVFSNFKAWMETKDWKGKRLDKDILAEGNKIYSPNNCIFVSDQLNKFMNNHGATKGDCPTGCYWSKRDKKYQAQCRNPFTSKVENLGLFTDDQAAHKAWKSRKHEFACEYAEQQDDSRVANALRTRFSK